MHLELTPFEALCEVLPKGERFDLFDYSAAVALLPHRKVLPAALLFFQETGYESEAEFVVILGRVSSYPGFRQVLVTPHGAVWSRLP